MFVLARQLLIGYIFSHSVYGMIIEEGKFKVKKEPTPFSASYVPTQWGPQVTKKYRQMSKYPVILPDQGEGEKTLNLKGGKDHKSLFKLDSDKISVVERFERIRMDIQKDSIPLKDFIEYDQFDDEAESWEGRCMSWSAAALDKNVSKIVANIPGVMCVGEDGKARIIENRDFKELFVVFYKDWADRFSGQRTGSRESQEKRVNQIDEAIAQLVGWNNYQPHEFFLHAFEEMESGNGVVVDTDSRIIEGAQVWNQPVESVELDISAFDEIPYKFIKKKFYRAIDQQTKNDIKEIREIDNLLLAVYYNKKKLLKNDFIDVINNLKPTSPGVKYAKNISGEMLMNLEDLRSVGANLKSSFNVFRNRKKELSRRVKDGLVLRPRFKLFKVDAKVTYGKESAFRANGHFNREINFTSYVMKDRRKPGNEGLFSKWKGSFDNDNRFDFAWTPHCMSEECDREKEMMESIYKEKLADWKGLSEEELKDARNIFFEEVYPRSTYQIGLSDLLKIARECIPLDHAIEQGKRFVELVELHNSVDEYEIEERDEILKLYSQIKSSKLPLKQMSVDDYVKKIQGVLSGKNGIILRGQTKDGRCEEKSIIDGVIINQIVSSDLCQI